MSAMQVTARGGDGLGPDVVIVGAGPVGCVLALELAAHGVESTVVERSTSPSRHPKMDYVSARSMELLSRLGLAEEIRRRGVPPEHPATFSWTLGLDRPPVATWRHPSVADWAALHAQRTDGSDAPQAYQRVQGSLLESVLRRRIEEHPLVRVLSGQALTTFEQCDDGVLLEVTDAVSGRSRRMRTRFLAGCDGANSTVRRSLGVERDLLAEPSTHCSVYFRSSDPVLRRHGRAFVTIAAQGLTLVSRDEGETWTASIVLWDGEPPEDPMAAVQARLGVPVRVDQLISMATWEGCLGLAHGYRRGPVFLVGDSAHQFQPTGGYGANTGIADAVDLGWKLAATLAGWAGPALLDSYEAERRPVALFNLEASAALLEVWRRFGRLGRAGAPVGHIAGYLAAQEHQQDNLGVHADYRYDDSPVVHPSDGDPPPWSWHDVCPRPWPGVRAPNVRLGTGEWLHDRLGTTFTLLDTSDDGSGASLVEAAAGLGVPLTHLPLNDPGVRRVWPQPFALVRPDHHVAWLGGSAPTDWHRVLDRVRGAQGSAAAPVGGPA